METKETEKNGHVNDLVMCGTKSLSLQGGAGGTGRWHCHRVIVEVDHINAADD